MWKRDSNIELLRIVSMVLVLVSHASYTALVSHAQCQIPVSLDNTFWYGVSESFSVECEIAFILSSVGAISHLIFVIHPSTRSLVRWLQATYDWSWQFSVLFYIILTLLLSFFVYKSSIIKSLWKRIILE